MSLYLKVVPPIASLIPGIFSLTVPEGAKSQQPTDAQAQTPKEAPVELGQRFAFSLTLSSANGPVAVSGTS
jgi:hypothetical protein